MKTFAEYTDIINKAITDLDLNIEPNGLYEPVRYILDLGGKRLRPALALMSASLFTDKIDDVVPAALSLEVFHNFTLLHDDIMDKADVRRGKKTVHKVWDENTGILSGDAAMIMAYHQLSLLPPAKFVEAFKVFNRTAIEVCEGQQYDMEFETRNDVILDEYLGMIRLKTAVLIAASLQIGAIAAGANEVEQFALYEIGENLGMAFQLQDDYLDVYSNAEKFGKATGGDIVNNKKTYLLIKALNSGEDKLVPQLQDWINKTDFDPAEKVKAVKDIYDKLGAGDDAQLSAINYINQAIEILNTIDIDPERKKPLEELIFKMMYRDK